jgi:hypothetical protein
MHSDSGLKMFIFVAAFTTGAVCSKLLVNPIVVFDGPSPQR